MKGLERNLPGIDVSAWQGKINFDEVKASGKQLVYIKSGQGSYEDCNFKANASNAQKAGLKIGFYYYVTAQTTDEAATQAEHFADLIKDYSYDCIPAVDYEEFGNLTNEEINEVAIAFIETLEAKTQTTPLFYTDVSNAEYLWDKSLSRYPLWIADYGVNTPTSTGYWSNWAGFQYTDSGAVLGIPDKVDLDYFTSEVILSNTGKPPKQIKDKDGTNTLGEGTEATPPYIGIAICISAVLVALFAVIFL